MRVSLVFAALAACGGKPSPPVAPVSNEVPKPDAPPPVTSACGCTTQACADAEPETYFMAKFCEMVETVCACATTSCVGAASQAFSNFAAEFVKAHPDLAKAKPDVDMAKRAAQLADRMGKCVEAITARDAAAGSGAGP